MRLLHKAKASNITDSVITVKWHRVEAAQPGRAADTAGAVRGLGAIYPAKRYGLLATRQPATSSHF